tara:strand:- start:1154 stop:1615 length:462 start_codon:yes stop_codon:yes gene_type:complete
MKNYIYILIFISIAFTNANADTNKITFQNSSLTIQTKDSEYIFNIEIAVTEKERSRGLMYRKELKQTEGMLFLYPEKQIIKMWMKNTLIPLDMIFINNNGKIIDIFKMTIPKDLTPIGPDVKLKGVLEINGGLTSYLNINKGDFIIHPSLNGK